jgi:predicted HNH restriction endonuclease
MTKSYELLTADEQRDVAGECMACLAYFATVTGRCRRTKVQRALAGCTRSSETPDAQSCYNWWNSKLANIQYAFYFNALNGATIHQIPTIRKKGKGRSGLSKDQEGKKLSKAQISINTFALNYFQNDLDLCKKLALAYIDDGARLIPEVKEALFGFEAEDEELINHEDRALVLEQALSGRVGIEGSRKLALHYRRERDAGLSRDAKAAFAKANGGKLFCQACGFEPLKVYGVEVIEAHHRIPLSKSEEGRVTEISDLIMLCPSCHRAVHRIPDCDFEALKLKLKG